jgi:hypothetical protein
VLRCYISQKLQVNAKHFSAGFTDIKPTYVFKVPNVIGLLQEFQAIIQNFIKGHQFLPHTKFTPKYSVILMFVDPCIKVQFIKKIQEDAIMYPNLLFHIYMKLNMFRATHRPSSRA